MKMADDEFKDFVAVSLLLLCPLSHYCSFSFRCIAWFHNHRTKSRASSRKLPPFVGASLKKLRTRPSGICCTFAYFVPLIQQSFVSTSFFKQGRNTGTPTAGEVRASRAMQDCVDCGLVRPATVLLAGRSSTYGWKSTIWVGCPDLILEIDCISIIVVPCTVADSLGHILFTASGLQAWWLFLNPTATEALEFPTHVCFACSSLGFTFRGRARDEAHDAQRAQKRERTTETTRTKHYTTCDFMLAFGMTRAQTFFTPVRCWRMMETAILEKTIIKSLGVSFMLAGIRQNYSIEGLPGFGCT